MIAADEYWLLFRLIVSRVAIRGCLRRSDDNISNSRNEEVLRQILLDDRVLSKGQNNEQYFLSSKKAICLKD